MNIRPYGDTSNDGKVQISFTLPIPADPRGMACAVELARKMGIADPAVVHCDAVGEHHSFYIIYGTTVHAVDPETVVARESAPPALSMEQIETLIAEKIGRDIVFVGASTGTDAHTVGIDAIMNMKGYAGHYGLERYRHVVTYNMGSQVPNEAFVKKAREVKADVLLVSQTVTQKDVHLANMVELVELLEAEGMREDVILIAGGARITNELAKELGYDAGFGPRNYAEDVATYVVREMIRCRNRG
jgi:beta-lysine 5,6-aminomutase beta subunit